MVYLARSPALGYLGRPTDTVFKTLRPLFWTTGVLAILLLLAGTPRMWTSVAYADRVYLSPMDVPAESEPRIAIVFGAGLSAGGGPSPVLFDRVATAVDLYNEGRVRKLLMTGDNRFAYYNEPEAMRDTAISLGVPASDIVLDYAGRRTYDSCYRAREIFEVHKAIVVTQAFHIDRALYLCEAFGIDAIGVTADRRQYVGASWWSAREVLATAAAWVDIHITHPLPILGDKLPIDPKSESDHVAEQS